MLNLTIISSLFVEKSLGVQSSNPAAAAIEGIEDGTPRALNAITDKSLLWEYGTVYYEYNDTDYTISDQDKQNIRKALNDLEEKTGQCVKFVPSTEGHRVKVTRNKEGGCGAAAGKKKDMDLQTLNLGSGCMSHGLIQHEFMHVLGIIHTLNRSDRDDYVAIYTNNADDKVLNNFYKYDDVSHYSLPYDYDSVMHYSTYEFGANGPRVEAKVKAKQSTMGQRDGVSFLDIKLIQSLYGCIKKNDCIGYANNNYCKNEFRPWMDEVCKGHCSDLSPTKPSTKNIFFQKWTPRKEAKKTTNNGCKCSPGSICEEVDFHGYSCWVGLKGDSGCKDEFLGFSKKACDLSPTKPSTKNIFSGKSTPRKEAKKTINNSCKCLPGFSTYSVCEDRSSSGLGYSCWVGLDGDSGCNDEYLGYSKKACEP